MAERLNQVIAVEKDAKNAAYAAITEYNKVAQKPDLFNGFMKTYRPKEEGGEVYPAEAKKVQFRVADFFTEIKRLYGGWLDLMAAKDLTNCKALASVSLPGVGDLPALPATFLLGLEKVLADLKTFASNLPELPAEEFWDGVNAEGLNTSEPVEIHRTKKVQKGLVLHPPTVEHPAQTQLITEDEVVGYWKIHKVSSAIPRTQKQAILERIAKLAAAVKKAREEANMTEVQEQKVGNAILSYVFGM